tara:strand:- start:110 stop:538 length:429 start_codon:yes stop_codon:yes gene_type:complete
MINIFKNKEKRKDDNSEYFTKIASLLIHAAKIDETYTDIEKEIVKKTLIELGAEDSNIEKLIDDATIIEEKSNQILDFTREIKNTAYSDKIKIIEALWKIIYSNNYSDMYEDNLMRRLSGLLYIDAKVMGNLKEKIKKQLIK